MVKQNIFDFIELFQIRSLISIDDLCGIHFKLTHIPKNVYLSKDEHLKHQQSIVFSFMLVKSIMDNFLLSDFANAITVENKDFVHNMKVLKDLPFDALQFTRMEQDEYKAFNKDNNIFPAITEISSEILSKDGVSVFQKGQPESSIEAQVIEKIDKNNFQQVYNALYNYRTSSFSASFKKLDRAVRELLRKNPVKPAAEPKKDETKI